VAGACATATHGSGVTNANLAAAQRAVELVTADGERRTVTRADGDFPAVAVGLGAFGAVTAVTLAVEPTYGVRQVLFEDLPLVDALAHFDEIMAGAYSVSLFTTWRTDAVDQVWCKCRDDEPTPDVPGARLATRALHPIGSLSAEPCTEQLGVPGPWHERLPHFRLGFTPSSGAELQSELFVDAAHGPDALRTLAAMADELAPVVQVSEVRTVAADDLWLSPCCGRASVAFHFTWVPSWAAVEPVLRRVEAALAPFGARPHWGKLSTMDGGTLYERYPRLADAAAAMDRVDPHGRFRNAFLDRVLGG
jgi:xylitol oxidase